ncbi:hypothetical protein PanABDRAFT_3981 [Pantoea sp. aB]|nr:hypothetical protein PanABDRAFT_3981 [Pantoea sp. aB]
MKTRFTHDPVDTEKPPNSFPITPPVISKLSRPTPVAKNVLLPEFREEPKPSCQYNNPMWS